MADELRISNIKVGRAPVPIHVRIIRRWKPFAKAPRLSYLLVDKHGDAVQAMFDESEDIQLQQKVTLMNCYRLDVYNCIAAPNMYKVALNSAAIRIDSTAPFIEIPDDGGIPHTYYNFQPYQSLVARADTHRVLTDFYGMVYSIRFGDTRGRTPGLRLNLEERSGERIQLALWPEIADMLDIERLLDSDFKLIIAVASVKVTTYLGVLQLESTSATRIEIEPEMEAARALRVIYHERNPVDPADVAGQKIQVEVTPSETNRVKIGQLLDHDLLFHRGMVYTCDAEITAFTPEQSWRYGTCPACKRTMDREDGAYVCVKHRHQEPKYMYCVKAEISDGTGTVSVTIFDQPMTAILGIPCNEMVRQTKDKGGDTIPKPIEELKNRQKIFQLNNPTRDSKTKFRFAVNRVYTLGVGDKRRLEDGSSSSSASSKKQANVDTDTEMEAPVITNAPNDENLDDTVAAEAKGKQKHTPPHETDAAAMLANNHGKSLVIGGKPSAGIIKPLFHNKGGGSSAAAEQK